MPLYDRICISDLAAISLSTVTVLYVTSPGLTILYWKYKFLFYNSFHSSPISLLRATNDCHCCLCVCVCVCVLECEHGLAITVTEEGSLFRLESFLAQGSSCNEVTVTLLSQLLTQVGEASKERILSNHKSESFHRHVPPQPFFDSQSFEEPL